MNKKFLIPFILSFQSAVLITSVFIGLDYIFNRKMLVEQDSMFLILMALLFATVFFVKLVSHVKNHERYFEELLNSREQILLILQKQG